MVIHPESVSAECKCVASAGLINRLPKRVSPKYMSKANSPLQGFARLLINVLYLS